MQVIKSVLQVYESEHSTELSALLEDFKEMTNDCINIGIRENSTSLKSLSSKAYRRLSGYDVLSYYKLTAMSSAIGILRNHRRTQRKNSGTKRPYVRHPFIVTCYGFKIVGDTLKIPIGERRTIDVALNAHTCSEISGKVPRSVTIKEHTVSISFAKDVQAIKPKGVIGIDRNLNNITCIGSSNDKTLYKLDMATRIKEDYRKTKSHFTRNDHRKIKEVYSKYGRRQRNRINQMLHNVSKRVVENARENESAIAMEKLVGIRKLYKRGNGQGNNYRFTLNSWSYAELQRQIEYKAKWEGLQMQPQKAHYL